MKIEPMKLIIVTINLDNDEKPYLIQIGSTLTLKEKKNYKKHFERILESLCLVLYKHA